MAVVATVAALLTAGCASDVSTGWLPSDAETTDQTGLIISLWNGSWIAALGVGVIVWGLTIWCVTAYRRRREDVGFPSQLRYNVPLEIMYTVIPFFMVAVLFFFTARDQAVIEGRDGDADVRIGVVGKQWSWDFNYTDEDVYETGIQADLESPQVAEELPVLYLPVGQKVELTLEARDVIHSFWVPAFLYKKDTIPGRTNYYEFVPEKEGTYAGRCAELCGEFHSQMLFEVRVVSEGEYEDQIQSLRDAGQTGQLPVNLGRTDTEEGEQVEDEVGEDSGGQDDDEEGDR